MPQKYKHIKCRVKNDNGVLIKQPYPPPYKKRDNYHIILPYTLFYRLTYQIIS